MRSAGTEGCGTIVSALTNRPSDGEFIRATGMRISLHPGQYTLLNSPRPEVVAAAHADLVYHARVLDLLGLDRTAKIQIHIGGLYGDKPAALARFIRAVERLDPPVRARLIVENDERLFNLDDCLAVSRETGLPVLLDTFHREIYPDGRTLPEALTAAAATWAPEDGPPMVDYSSSLPGGRPGSHAHALDEAHFRRFLEESRPHDFDLMLEVKDKERSALQALAILKTTAAGCGPTQWPGRSGHPQSASSIVVGAVDRCAVADSRPVGPADAEGERGLGRSGDARR